MMLKAWDIPKDDHELELMNQAVCSLHSKGQLMFLVTGQEDCEDILKTLRWALKIPIDQESTQVFDVGSGSFYVPLSNGKWYEVDIFRRHNGTWPWVWEILKSSFETT